MRCIDADALAADMKPIELVEALRAGHRSGAMSTVERLLLEQPAAANAALIWAGWDDALGIAVKTATVFPGNGVTGQKPNIQSVVVLFDPTNGTPLAAIHGESFTRMKTAADSALAADILATAHPTTLAVLGAGGQAETHIRFHLAVRPSIGRVLIWNRSFEAAARLAATLSISGVVIEAVRDAEAAVREAGVVACLTASSMPVLKGAWLRAGTHVDLVGAYTPMMRESDDDVVLLGRLFADSLRFGVMTCGDYAIPIDDGVVPRTKIEGDLFDLCSGRNPGRRSSDEITVCKNGGGGHLDLMTARALYDAATGRPIGASQMNVASA